MGNAAKRRELAKLAKTRGLGRLYRGNRRVAVKFFNAHTMAELHFKLQFKTGDIVHDCDGFNHEFLFWDYPTRWIRGASSMLFVEQAKFADGKLSCGCPYGPSAPMKQSEIEAYMKAYYNDPALEKNGWLSNETCIKRRNALNNNEHICDERGFLLEEFAYLHS